MKRALVTTVATTAAAPPTTCRRLENGAHALMLLSKEPAHYVAARVLDTFLFKGHSDAAKVAARRKKGRGPRSHGARLAKERARKSKVKSTNALSLVEDATEREQLEAFVAANTPSSMLLLLGAAQPHSDGDGNGVDAADIVDGAATNGDADLDGGEFGGGTGDDAGTTDAAWGGRINPPE